MIVTGNMFNKPERQAMIDAMGDGSHLCEAQLNLDLEPEEFVYQTGEQGLPSTLQMGLHAHMLFRQFVREHPEGLFDPETN